MPAGEHVDHEQGQLMELFLQLAELVLLVAAAAPHVIALLSHMRDVTQQRRTEVEQGTQRPTQVTVYPCPPCCCA